VLRHHVMTGAGSYRGEGANVGAVVRPGVVVILNLL
jgi:hypothetical protein